MLQWEWWVYQYAASHSKKVRTRPLHVQVVTNIDFVQFDMRFNSLKTF